MKTVFIVTYERYDHFEIKEVFDTRELALKYLESDTVSKMVDEGYKLDCFYILEKILWSDE